MKSLEALRALGTGSEPPPEAKQRVEGAVFAALEAAALVGAASSVPKAAARVSAHPVPASLFAGVAGSKVLAVAASIWLMGGITGAALYRALRPTDVRVVYVDRPTLGASSVANAVAVLEPAPRVEPGEVTSAAPHGAAARANLGSADGTSDLARERALLDLARAAASHGEPARVLAIVQQHRERFPRGRLAEEREALAIRALLALGRRPEAVARAQAFRAAYPSSFLIPVIDSALANP